MNNLVLEVLILKDFKSFEPEVLILRDFKSFEPEVLILRDFKSLFPEVLIPLGFKPFVISEMQEIEIFLEVLILEDLGSAMCVNGGN